MPYIYQKTNEDVTIFRFLYYLVTSVKQLNDFKFRIN